MAPVSDGKIHGMVSASVGAAGYREGAVAVEGPLGNGGYFALAVDGAQIDAGRASRVRAPSAAPAN